VYIDSSIASLRVFFFITVHVSINADDGTLKELHSASGGAWGGIKVDQAFEQLLIDIFEEDVFAEFLKKHAADYFEMGRDFEVKKRTVQGNMNKNTYIKLPISLMFLEQLVTLRTLQLIKRRWCLLPLVDS
jgi:hypothetical protein